MSRAAVLALVAAAVALAGVAWGVVGALDSGSAPQRGWTVAEMERELMCPTCETRLDMSTQPAADRIRGYLEERRADGWTRTQVREALIAEYGERVIAATPRRGFGLAAWLVPALVAAVGLVVALVLARRWAASRTTAPATVETGPRSVEQIRLEARLDAELERFE